MRDPRAGTIEGFIAALEILAKYLPNGKETKYFMGGEHDVVYVYVSSESCPSDSEDGNKLVSLGWRIDSMKCWSFLV